MIMLVRFVVEKLLHIGFVIRCIPAVNLKENMELMPKRNFLNINF